MSEALKLAEEANRMMIDFAEEVWQAGKDGFRCDSIASCRESRSRAESAIEALASQAESEARDAARLDWLEAESAEDVDNAEIWASWPAEHDRLRTAIDAAMAEKEQTR